MHIVGSGKIYLRNSTFRKTWTLFLKKCKKEKKKTGFRPPHWTKVNELTQHSFQSYVRVNSYRYIIEYNQIILMHRVEIWWLLAGFCPVAAITCWYSRPRMSYKDGDGLISSSSHHLSWIRDPSKFRFISQLQCLQFYMWLFSKGPDTR